MRRTGLLHAQLAAVIAAMGHGDTLVIADAGLPIPPGVTCIDLAVSPGVPGVLDVLAAVAGDLVVERFLLADELLARDAMLPIAVRAFFPDASEDHAPHETFKQHSRTAAAIVRTGEFTPYANVLLVAGVPF